MESNKPFRVQAQSSSPKISSAEVFLPKGKGEYETGWFVSTLSPKAFEGEKIVISAFPRQDFQIAATLDFRQKKRRIVFLLGKLEPFSRLVVSMPAKINPEKENKVVVYWSGWKLEKAEWNGEELAKIKDTTPVRVSVRLNNN